MSNAFGDFDVSTFWSESEYALRKYVGEPPTPELVRSIEEELGYKLPSSYIELMQTQNGGIPVNCSFPVPEPTPWADEHVSIAGIFGIGREKTYSLCGSLGSRFMMDEWGYPDIGVYFADCPSAGHNMICFDYRKHGRQGEPEIVHVAKERYYEVTFLANDFETFIKGLVNDEVYE